MNRTLRAVAASGLCLALSISLSAQAKAEDDRQYRLINTAGLGAYPRSEPQFEARTGSALPEGAMITASCWTYGQSVTNPYGYTSDVWIKDPAAHFWPEVWLDTGSNGVPPGLVNCDSATTANPPVPNSFYNRAEAVKWAIAQAPYDVTGLYHASACTWFVSQALWAGGFGQDATWTSVGEHNRLRKVPGSATAWSVTDLRTYLETPGRLDIKVVQLGPDQFRANSVPDAEPGDLLVYDWDGDGTWDHFTIVTSIAPGSYPEVSEWGVNNTYVKRGWTYSINDGTWLQVRNPNVVAELIHFNGGVWIDVPHY
ncbi:MAG: amidase domain-containing protein [Propionibacteriales bacterium]|nr:amidase domain-containing protein [Propionibacteriales bacterium]